MLIPLTHSNSFKSITTQGYSVTYNPTWDGDCQFTALTHLLQRMEVHRSPHTLSAELVQYLEDNDKFAFIIFQFFLIK